MRKIQEIRLDSWTEFDRIALEHRFRDWVYRGQTDSSWILESSLFRSFRDVLALTRASRLKPKKLARKSHERVALKKFISAARQYDVPLPLDDDPLEWLSVMQHYGAPTRLLDATFSPYVAAYFSLESGIENAAVYCIRQKVFREYDEQSFENVDAVYRKILDEDNDDVMYVYEPRHTTPRLLAQQGLFLVPGSLSVSHEKIVEAYSLKGSDAFKLVIPKKLRDDGIHHLRRMNITSTMLFPGIGGFCKSFWHQPLFVVQSEGRVGDLGEESKSDELRRAKRV